LLVHKNIRPDAADEAKQKVLRKQIPFTDFPRHTLVHFKIYRSRCRSLLAGDDWLSRVQFACKQAPTSDPESGHSIFATAVMLSAGAKPAPQLKPGSNQFRNFSRLPES
jgi:hypothetical protein